MAASSSNALRVAKQHLRVQLKEALKAMSSEKKIEESVVLAQKVRKKVVMKTVLSFSSTPLKQLLKCEEYISANRVSVYLHMPVEEVDTTHVMKNIFESKKSCFVPRFIGDQMDMLQVHSMEDVQSLPIYKWGIKQPSADDHSRNDALKTGGLDLIIVPGLGFTKSYCSQCESGYKEGKRLGRGKGFYDRFIGKCHELNDSTKTIALAYSVQECADVPVNEYDRIIDRVLFP